MLKKLSCLIWICVAITAVAHGQGNIALDQVGYYPDEQKIAVVTNSPNAKQFFIINSKTHDTVYFGTVGAEHKSGYSSTTTRFIDFSEVTKKGDYIIDLPGVGRSCAFKIDDRVYGNAAVTLLKGYYFMRSNQALDEKFAGKWKRVAGHPDTVVFIHPSAASILRPSGTIISSPGGWYDAGDYNKYVVNSGITMGTLLSAYEDFSEYFDSLNSHIPESANDVPDILDEVIYNLRWMLTMQDPSDGGVYHKLTNASFDGMVMPNVTKAPRYAVQKSTAATLDFAAVMAQASRVFKKSGKELSVLADTCLTVSISAWEWAMKNPSVVYSQNIINKNNEPQISTGEYGDQNFTDEKFWAAAELYATTGDSVYYTLIKEGMKRPVHLPSWGDVAMLGYYTLIRNETILKNMTLMMPEMKATLMRMAEDLVNAKKSNAFGSVMPQNKRDFVWGSNSVAANQGMLLIRAYLTTKNKKYLEGAISNLHYLFGRNATGYCFVTGMGSKSPMHPHHRPSESDGIVEPIPGLLVGGPNPGMQDGCKYPFTEPETAYVDEMCSYASNEIAINWNAPAVYLVNAIEALHTIAKHQHSKIKLMSLK